MSELFGSEFDVFQISGDIYISLSEVLQHCHSLWSVVGRRMLYVHPFSISVLQVPPPHITLCFFSVTLLNRDQPSGAYMRPNDCAKYPNRVVHQFDNLPCRSGLVSYVIERFGRAHQGSKADGLTLNLMYWLT